MQLITPEVVLSYLPKRAPSAHKGNFGRVLVVAGSRRMCGAGALCATAALRVGAGLVAWALPKSMQPAFAAALPEVITIPLAETSDGLLATEAQTELQKFCASFKPSVLACGPGMGPSPLFDFLFEQVDLPIIVDADALNFLAAHSEVNPPKTRPCIFTPHPGEMARLLGAAVVSSPADRQAQVRAWVEISGGITVLKGKGTLVASQTAVWENTTGSEALAKGGSGDVLTGMIAGFWAQLGTACGFTHESGLQAALEGVYVHGLAGEIASESKTSYSVLARDILAQIPMALKQILHTGSSL